jgi:YebC/PmpR family DNA-binding regulatory protein
MSGHSHYATIKRKKESTDAAKGRMFSKMSRAILVAIKTDGGSNPETNYKLRVAIDTAKAANMPKANIERILKKADEEADLEEIKYEGFGPEGILIVVDVATDNRNRSSQEIKGIFDRGEGRLAGPGAVSYNFDSKGMILTEKKLDTESQMLGLIDLGIDDIQETEEGIEMFTEPDKLSETLRLIRKKNINVFFSGLVMRPKNLRMVSNPTKAKRAISFLQKLEDHDDVQNVFTNLDVPEEIADNL